MGMDEEGVDVRSSLFLLRFAVAREEWSLKWWLGGSRVCIVSFLVAVRISVDLRRVPLQLRCRIRFLSGALSDDSVLADLFSVSTCQLQLFCAGALTPHCSYFPLLSSGGAGPS